MRKRVVVVGAGIGGLSAALELATRDDLDVTVLEQADVPGGKMRELEAAGRRIDSGPTVFTMRWVFDRLFELAGTQLDDELTLHRAPRLARHVWPDGSRLDLFVDVDASVEAIREFAGNAEADAYRRFARDSETVFETLRTTFMERDKPGPVGLTFSMGLSGIPRLIKTKPFTSLWSELGRYFNDPRLRQLFARYATYCGSSPFEAPATLMLIAHAERVGVAYVDGGMQRLAEALVRVAERQGVEFRFDTAAREIVARNGRVTGVVDERGHLHEADAAVFNGDVQALTRGRLGDDVQSAVTSRREEPRSLSAITWSLAADVGGFPLDHHTVFFGRDYPAEFAALFDQSTICGQPTVYVCAQDRSDARAPDGSERLFVLVNAPARSMSDAELESAESAVGELLGNAGLEVDLAGDDATRFTPNDFADRFPETDGAIYGWPTHGMFGSFRRDGARSRIGGLYLAGGSVHPGPGVPMTAISGSLAARAVFEALAV